MRDVSRVQDININRHSNDGRQREVTIKFIMKRYPEVITPADRKGERGAR